MSTEQPTVVITPEDPKKKPADLGPKAVPATEDLNDDDLESVAGGGQINTV